MVLAAAPPTTKQTPFTDQENSCATNTSDDVFTSEDAPSDVSLGPTSVGPGPAGVNPGPAGVNPGPAGVSPGPSPSTQSEKSQRTIIRVWVWQLHISKLP